MILFCFHMCETHSPQCSTIKIPPLYFWRYFVDHILPSVFLLGFLSTLSDLIKDIFQTHTVFSLRGILGHSFIHIITDICHKLGIRDFRRKKIDFFYYPPDLAYINGGISSPTWYAYTDSWLNIKATCRRYKELICV